MGIKDPYFFRMRAQIKVAGRCWEMMFLMMPDSLASEILDTDFHPEMKKNGLQLSGGSNHQLHREPWILQIRRTISGILQHYGRTKGA
jgi:hypothetical protein